MDRALLTGASDVEVMMAKQSQIDEPVAESLQEHGQSLKLITGILQKAIGYLRGFVEFLREMKYCDRDPEGNAMIDHDIRIDIMPEPFPVNVQCAEKRAMQNSTGKKRSIHERLEEKKQIAEQQLKKKKQRNGMEL